MGNVLLEQRFQGCTVFNLSNNCRYLANRAASNALFSFSVGAPFDVINCKNPMSNTKSSVKIDLNSENCGSHLIALLKEFE